MQAALDAVDTSTNAVTEAKAQFDKAKSDADKLFVDAGLLQDASQENLLAAQADYDKFAKEEEDKQAATVSLDKSATKAARTGDNTPIIAYAAAGALALATVAVVRPKVKFKKQK